MSKADFLLGLDIGSANVRGVMVQHGGDEGTPRVMGAVTNPSEGMRRGVVIDADTVGRTCTKVIDHLERMSGSAAGMTVVGISGPDVFCQNAPGVVAVSRADGEVSEDDVDRVIGEVESRVLLPANREIIHVIPRSYRLDDQKDIKDPIGMRGVRLEADAFVIGTSTTQMKGLTRIFDGVGIAPDSYAVEPIAAAEALLNPKQKELGVALLNIGGSTTSLAVFEEGELIQMSILPVGGTLITNDIAIGLRTSVETAETIKKTYGHAIAREIGKRDLIDLSAIDSHEGESVSRYHVSEIIEARMEEILTLANEELRRIGHEGRLPAGVVLAGGGALLSGVVDLAKETLRLPVQVGYPKPLGGIFDRVDSPEYATAVGLVLLGAQRRREGSGGLMSKAGGTRLPSWVMAASAKAREWGKRFLPLD